MERYRQGLDLVIEMLRRANPRDFRVDSSTLEKVASLPRVADERIVPAQFQSREAGGATADGKPQLLEELRVKVLACTKFPLVRWHRAR
jgi:hypothetical protein